MTETSPAAAPHHAGAWKAYVAAGLVVVVAFAASTSIAARGVLALLLFGSAVVALAVGIRWHRPTRPRVWYVLVAGFVTYLAAAVPWFLAPVVRDAPLPYPSVLDPVYFAAYTLFGVFLALLIRAHSGRGSGDTLDALIVAGGGTVLAWEFVLGPAIAAPDVSSLAKATSVGYPALLLLLLGLAIRLALVPARRLAVHWLLAIWLTGELAGDTWYAVSSARGTFSYESPWLVAWMLAYVALGTAALHPSMAALAEPAPQRPAGSSRRRLLVLGVAAMVPLVAIVGRAMNGTTRDLPMLAAVAATLFVLVLVRLAGLMVDLNEQRRVRAQLEDLAARLRHQAFHDGLTGLANRALLHDRLEHALAQRRRHADRGAGLLLVDVDGFKVVNDTLGHDVGDALLVGLARRLGAEVRAGDTVARLGGDEFAVVLGDVSLAEAIDTAERITAAAREPFWAGEREVLASASVGVVVPGGGEEAPTLLREADTALYAAKDERRGSYQVYVPELHEAILDRHRLRGDLKGAAVRGELVLHYQPIVELKTGAIVGVEALVRWRHPERGLLGPNVFVPLAEESGTIVEIGRWVLEEASHQVLAWTTADPARNRLELAVNLSPRQLQDPALVADVTEILARVGIDHADVTFEVTETALMSDTEEMIARLDRLKTLGVSIAIDDFGTGYSSLSYLRRLPIDIMKVDRSFVEGIAREPEEWALTVAIVKLATSLGKRTLAEGIELGEQLAHLRALGCELGQGYLFSKPLPAAEMETLLADHRARRPRAVAAAERAVDAPVGDG